MAPYCATKMVDLCLCLVITNKSLGVKSREPPVNSKYVSNLNRWYTHNVGNPIIVV